MLIESKRPELLESDIRHLAEDLFGILDIEVVKTLPSYLDQNFLIRTKSGAQYVFKIANPSEEKSVLDLQNKAMQYLQKTGFANLVPRVKLSKNGHDLEQVINRGQRFWIRVLSYLSGEILVHARPQKNALLKDIGHFLGNIDKALTNFEHAAAYRFMQWDLQQAAKIIGKNLHFFQQKEQCDLIDFFYQRFLQKTAKLLPTFRKQIIHADANNYNLLVQQDETVYGQLKAGGLLDFGDMVHTQLVNELAIAIAYAMQGKENPLEAILPMVEGYHETHPLTELEVEALFDLVCIRLCLTLSVGAHRQSIEPDNEYRDQREVAAWNLLRKLKSIPIEYAIARFRKSCHFSPTRNLAKNQNWIKQHPHLFGQPVNINFHKEEYLVFDLSIGTSEFAGIEWEDRKAIANHLVKRIKTANAKAGITRYNEARLFFNSKKYSVPNDEYEAYRNVHLGMDIILEEGSKALAVLDGTVHHIIQNDPEKDLKNAVVLRHEPTEGICFFTIYGNIKTDLQIGEKIDKNEVIGQLVFLNNWAPHLHFQLALDLVGFDKNFPVATAAEKATADFWKLVSPNPNLLLKIPAKKLKDTYYSLEEIIEKRKRLLGKNQKFYYQAPINIVRSKAQWLYDDTGRKYLDSLNNVTHVGHCHPKVVDAITRQSYLLNTNSRLLYENIVKYAERLVATLPEPLSVCYYVCSGSEANDLALRLARHFTGHQDMLILDGAYHGNTTAVEQISPNRFDGVGGKGAMPFIHKVPQPNLYRGMYQYGDEQAGEKYALEVKNIIDQLAAKGKGIAGFIGESLMGTAGQVVLPPHYLKNVYEYVRTAGGICIADEVQVGFGRVGEKFWCFETQAIVPDIVVMGKPIANGHPMAMVVTTPEIAEAYNTGMKYFNTFGGNPVSCAAGLAVLDIIEEENLQAHALEVGNYFLHQLKELQSQYALIGDVRGKGLYLGVEFVTNRSAKTPAKTENYYIAERMKECGIITYPNGKFDNCLKIKPPMVFNKVDVDYYVDSLSTILKETVIKKNY